MSKDLNYVDGFRADSPLVARFLFRVRDLSPRSKKHPVDVDFVWVTASRVLRDTAVSLTAPESVLATSPVVFAIGRAVLLNLAFSASLGTRLG